MLERAEGGALNALPFGIALRNTPDGDGDLPFDTYPSVPPPGSVLKPTIIALASDDPSQPLMFRGMRAAPPIDWTDGLQGARQTKAGFKIVEEWRLGLRPGHLISSELRILADRGVIMLVEDHDGPSATAIIGHEDGSRFSLRLPDVIMAEVD